MKLIVWTNMQEYFFPQDTSFAEEDVARQRLGTPNLSASPQRSQRLKERGVHRYGERCHL
jgi:hypothetical protein